MKQLDKFKQWLARHLLRPANARWASCFALLLLAAVAFGKPAYTHMERQDARGWTKAVVVEAESQCAAGRDAAQDFGRQLDTLTAFYETIISVLLGVIAVVAGLAFWTIKVVSRNQAEETAQAAAEKIIGSHDGFSNKLKDAVSREIGNRMEEVLEKIEDLEERTTGGEEEAEAGGAAAQPKVKARKRRSRTKRDKGSVGAVGQNDDPQR